jgi:hypothetical protein
MARLPPAQFWFLYLRTGLIPSSSNPDRFDYRFSDRPQDFGLNRRFVIAVF